MNTQQTVFVKTRRSCRVMQVWYRSSDRAEIPPLHRKNEERQMCYTATHEQLTVAGLRSGERPDRFVAYFALVAGANGRRHR